MLDLAVRDELADDRSDGVGRDCEPDAVGAAGLALDLGIDADDASSAVDERPARVSVVDRRIRLDRVRDRVVVGRGHLAVERAHDAARHRSLEPERASERENGVANGDRARIGETQAARAAPSARRCAGLRCRSRDRLRRAWRRTRLHSRGSRKSRRHRRRRAGSSRCARLRRRRSRSLARSTARRGSSLRSPRSPRRPSTRGRRSARRTARRSRPARILRRSPAVRRSSCRRRRPRSPPRRARCRGRARRRGRR